MRKNMEWYYNLHPHPAKMTSENETWKSELEYTTRESYFMIKIDLLAKKL